MRTNFTTTNHSYLFVNSFINRRNGFAHESELYIDESIYPSVTNRVSYINRTWEAYEYQSSMLGAVNKLKKNLYQQMREEFLVKNNIKRLTPKFKDELEKEVAIKCADLNELISQIRQR